MRCTDALAFEAAAALDAYEEHLLTLRRHGAQPWRIALFHRQLRRVCSCCLGLPQVSGASVALLLAHHRWLAELCAEGRLADAAAPSLVAVEQCLGSLQRACRELFVAPHLH